MWRFGLFVALTLSCHIAAAQTANFSAVDNGDGEGDILIHTSQARETFKAEVSMEWGWGAGGPCHPTPFDISQPQIAVAPHWVPTTSANPYTGGDTSGIYFDPEENHLFASFETTDLSAGTIDFLEFDYTGSNPSFYQQLDAFAVFTEDGVVGDVVQLISIIVDPPFELDGDKDNDCDVDIIDFGHFADAFGSTGLGLWGDFDHDGDVDITDFGRFANNFGIGTTTAAAVPEPLAAALLAIGMALATSGRGRC